MEFKEVKKIIDKLAVEEYKNLIMSLISLETGIEDETALEIMYIEYMHNDNITGLFNEITTD